MNVYFAGHALLPGGWAQNVRFEIGASGSFTSVTADSAPAGATVLRGIVLPGMPNVHSHAFQRALAGRTDVAGPAGDSFWTWREAMYAELEALGPDEFESIATAAYAEMLAAGYTTVCEFHYVHNAPGGTPYARPTELADRIVAAARATGIGLTLLPVLYRFSDFGAEPPTARQARFVQSFDDFSSAWLALDGAYANDPQMTLGLGPHSLRAVEPADVARLVALAGGRGRTVPLHVHVCEQTREVEACRAVHGTTPVALLARTIELSEAWCLVHATHATPEERGEIVRSNAVVGLCPTTEANLGDGIFPAAAFMRDGGIVALGTDSNVAIDVAQEVRLLEYVQRLVMRERNVMHDAATPSVARYLYTAACRGGAQASGRRIGSLAAGKRADFIALAPLAGVDPETALAMHVFRSGSWRVEDAFAGGRHVVREGRHVTART